MYHIFTDERINSEPLPLKSSLVNFSMYNELSCDVLFRSFSIKYVVQGTETYRGEGFDYSLNAGEYLLANHHSRGRVHIGSKEMVKGICIDVQPDIMSEVALSQNLEVGNAAFDSYFTTDIFPESKNAREETLLGPLLKSLEKEILQNPNDEFTFDKSFFYRLAEAIVLDQKKSAAEIFSINSVKSSTRKDLFRKLHLAKFYIDTEYMSIKSISQIARESCLSEYHFLRLFKLLFNQSPYQYLLERKLDHAHKLVLDEGMNVTEVASRMHYQDIASFSKAYKKKYGYTPSRTGAYN